MAKGARCNIISRFNPSFPGAEEVQVFNALLLPLYLTQGIFAISFRNRKLAASLPSIERSELFKEKPSIERSELFKEKGSYM